MKLATTKENKYNATLRALRNITFAVLTGQQSPAGLETLGYPVPKAVYRRFKNGKLNIRAND